MDAGFFGPTVKAAGAIIAASTAIGLAWRRRSKWEPNVRDIPDAPAKLASLVAGVVLVILWADGGKSIGFPSLPAVALISAAAAMLGLLIYVLLNASLLYEQEYAVTTTRIEKQKVIGGLWLTEVARKRKVEMPDLNVVIREAGGNINLVWPQLSRGVSQVIFVVAYMSLVIGGSVALEASALLAEQKIDAKPPAVIQPQ